MCSLTMMTDPSPTKPTKLLHAKVYSLLSRYGRTQWLDDLDALHKQLCERWNLTAVSPLDGGWTSAVILCAHPEWGKCVLRINSAPYDSPAAYEQRTMLAAAGLGPAVHAIDIKHQACVTEYVRGGAAWIQDHSLVMLAKQINELAAPKGAVSQLTRTEAFLAANTPNALTMPQWLVLAKMMQEQHDADNSTQMIHGDLHGANILRENGSGRLQVIDCSGCRGHWTEDVAWSLLVSSMGEPNPVRAVLDNLAHLRGTLTVEEAAHLERWLWLRSAGYDVRMIALGQRRECPFTHLRSKLSERASCRDLADRLDPQLVY